MFVSNRQSPWERSAIAVALGLAALVATPHAGEAQRQVRRFQAPAFISADGDPLTRDFNLAEAKRGFRLFSQQDLGFSGLRGSGNLWTAISNVGPCENGLPPFCHQVQGIFTVFEYPLIAGVPRGDWINARQRAPSLINAKGDGYSVMQNYLLFAGRMENGPDDGTLGTLFAGTASTSDGTCTDNTSGVNGYMDAGFPLLAASDCAPTWGGGVFAGDHPIPADNWLTLFQQQGTTFTFDFHRVPENLKRQDRFLGSRFATYGRISDHHGSILPSYGSVVPRGVGDPVIQGWPLGLIYEFQAYTFSLPTVASAYFWQMLVINRSEDVYGVGLDYDSLYVGIQQGTGHDPQADAEYWDPNRNALMHATNGVNTACNGSTAPAGVSACYTASSRGFALGASGIVFLKTPIGDMRNELFSDPSSPFYSPGHPLAGDTITINHGHMCGFGGCWANSHNVNDKRSFGMLSSTEDNVTDGRTFGAMGTTEYWRTFRSRAYPTRDGRFNQYLPPGGWDYNHDGVLDTLHFDSCGGPHGSAFITAGCVTTWADTMPGKQNNRYGNVGGITAAGPFRLAAGDTAAFMLAFVGDLDSIRFETTVNNVIDFYKTFFFGPEPAPPVNITSTEVVSGGDRSEVSIFFDDAAERWTDPFLISFADKIDAAAAGTDLGRLGALNPNLTADIRARASDNLDELHIYKSCDGGTSFTSDGDCDGEEAEDERGNPIGTGWQAYAIFRRDDISDRDLPNVFNDRNTLGGRSLLYVVLMKTRGAEFLVRDSLDLDGDGAFDVVGGRTVSIAPSLINPLSRSASDPNVVAVYVPFSRQAGSQNAALAFTSQAGGATVPFEAAFTEAVVGGRYRATFGNRLSIVETLDPATGSIVGSTVTVEDSVIADSAGLGVRRVYDTDQGASADTAGVPFVTCNATTTAACAPEVTTAGNTVTRVFSGVLGFVVFRDASNDPVLLSTNLTGAGATPATLFGRPNFAGFAIYANNTRAGQLAGEATIEDGDTLPQGNVNAFKVQWREQSTTRVNGSGDYVVQWSGDPFGVRRGFTLNFSDSAANAVALADSLSARTATAAPTDSALAALLGLASADLRPARLPFSVSNATTGRAVTVVVSTRLSNTILLGTGNDTIRAELPANEWVPGDPVALIEDVDVDSTVGGRVVLGSDGRPLRVLRRRVAFSRAVLGCDTPRESCNPVATGQRGASGYLALTSTTQTRAHYFVGFNTYSRYIFDVTPSMTGAQITTVSRAQLDSIRVVPNPFVVFSSFQSQIDESRVVFTHLPPNGTLRIYAVSGQFVQQLSWTPADLSASGDLHYNLRTREGNDMASGLYIWVMTTNVGNQRQTARGKFVVIRGRNF